MLSLLWWLGLAWFAGWAALPLLLVPVLGPFGAMIAWVLLAPWTALAGLTLVHRLLPDSEPGRFALPHDPGSIRWALKGWAPALYLTVFQPLYFTSEWFARVVLRAFGARIGAGAIVTSRTIVREPHHVRIGARTLVGEFVHLASAYQLRPGTLYVGSITIGEDVLVGAHAVLAPGVTVGDRCMLEHGVVLGANTILGAGTRVGEGTVIYTGARVGAGVRIGKRCFIHGGAVIPDGTHIADATVMAGHAEHGAAA